MAPIKVGDKIPSVELHRGFPPEKINVADYVKGKKVIILGLPGMSSTVKKRNGVDSVVFVDLTLHPLL